MAVYGFIATVLFILVETRAAIYKNIEFRFDGNSIVIPLNHPVHVKRINDVSFADLNLPNVPNLAEMILRSQTPASPPPPLRETLPPDREATTVDSEPQSQTESYTDYEFSENRSLHSIKHQTLKPNHQDSRGSGPDNSEGYENDNESISYHKNSQEPKRSSGGHSAELNYTDQANKPTYDSNLFRNSYEEFQTNKDVSSPPEEKDLSVNTVTETSPEDRATTHYTTVLVDDNITTESLPKIEEDAVNSGATYSVVNYSTTEKQMYVTEDPIRETFKEETNAPGQNTTNQNSDSTYTVLTESRVTDAPKMDKPDQTGYMFEVQTEPNIPTTEYLIKDEETTTVPAETSPLVQYSETDSRKPLRTDEQYMVWESQQEYVQGQTMNGDEATDTSKVTARSIYPTTAPTISRTSTGTPAASSLTPTDTPQTVTDLPMQDSSQVSSVTPSIAGTSALAQNLTTSTEPSSSVGVDKYIKDSKTSPKPRMNVTSFVTSSPATPTNTTQFSSTVRITTAITSKTTRPPRPTTKSKKNGKVKKPRKPHRRPCNKHKKKPAGKAKGKPGAGGRRRRRRRRSTTPAPGRTTRRPGKQPPTTRRSTVRRPTTKRSTTRSSTSVNTANSTMSSTPQDSTMSSNKSRNNTLRHDIHSI